MDASKCHRCHRLLSPVSSASVARVCPAAFHGGQAHAGGKGCAPADTSPSRPVGRGQGHSEARNATQGAPPSPEASYGARLGTGSSAHCPLSGKRWDIPEFMPHSRHLPPTRSQGRTPHPHAKAPPQGHSFTGTSPQPRTQERGRLLRAGPLADCSLLSPQSLAWAGT